MPAARGKHISAFQHGGSVHDVAPGVKRILSFSVDPRSRACNFAAVPTKIHDKHTEKPISRQRKYQLRHIAQGLCALCNRKLFTATKCRKHWKQERDIYKLGREALKRLDKRS